MESVRHCLGEIVSSVSVRAWPWASFLPSGRFSGGTLVANRDDDICTKYLGVAQRSDADPLYYEMTTTRTRGRSGSAAY